ncbi:hypothetical protein SDC9_70492 [bioreactor metagenome]|uniref:Uncharacterized protein n=1 Tax=bioreactor metagenome TaxID=1076179 RepID=A0A644Y641_9ZZZZ
MEPEATNSPLRNIVKLSDISNTSLSLWLTNKMAIPRSLSLRMILNRFLTSFLVSAVVGSSIMINLVLNIRALLMAIICFSATDRFPTYASRSTLKLILAIASSAIVLIRFQLTIFLPSANSLLNARFSMTVRFGNMEKSWYITWIPLLIASIGVIFVYCFPSNSM